MISTSASPAEDSSGGCDSMRERRLCVVSATHFERFLKAPRRRDPLRGVWSRLEIGRSSTRRRARLSTLFSPPAPARARADIAQSSCLHRARKAPPVDQFNHRPPLNGCRVERSLPRRSRRKPRPHRVSRAASGAAARITSGGHFAATATSAQSRIRFRSWSGGSMVSQGRRQKVLKGS